MVGTWTSGGRTGRDRGGRVDGESCGQWCTGEFGGLSIHRFLPRAQGVVSAFADAASQLAAAAVAGDLDSVLPAVLAGLEPMRMLLRR